MTPSEPAPSWRSLVPPAEQGAPLALGVALRQRTAAADAHWGPRRFDDVTPRALARRQDDLVLAVRPLVRGASGAWVRADVSWDAVRRASDRYRSAHARWFAELHSIAHDTRSTGPFAAVADWLVLDTVSSRLLWPHLAAAEALGIPIVSAHRQQSVRVARGADTGLELTATPGGDLRLAARLTVDGEPVDPSRMRPIGETGLYTFAVDRDPVPIVLAPGAVPAAVRAVASRTGGWTIAASEADAFLREAYPHLARATAVAATGVAMPRDAAPVAPRELSGDPRIRVTTVASTDPDWLELGILVEIDGRRIPFGPLLTALTRGRSRMRLSDGASFSLAHPALARLKELLEEAAALAEWETGPRLHRTQTALWADFEDLSDHAEPAVAWREVVRGLDPRARVDPVPLPSGLRAELRPYQRDGYDWLCFLHRHRLGGILADDMGLGKTVQTLAFLLHARAAGGPAFLVVAPTSVLSAWREQAERFAPGLTIALREETDARARVPLAVAAADADVVLTSYAVLRLDDDAFAALAWSGVVLDEAQSVKNPATRAHRAVQRLRRPTTIALTGTPLENGLADLWALLSLTAPGLFPSARRFREQYLRPIERGGVPENAEDGAFRAERLARLRRRIRPFVLRRTKELVAPELPPKQEQDVAVELSSAHRALYDRVLHRERQKVLGLLDDLDRQRFIVFRSLTLLRMLSLAPVLVDPAHAPLGSAKLDALVAHLVEVAAEGHRALVFSQFTSFLDLVQARLDAAGLGFSRLDGSTTRRGDVIDGFRGGDAPVFLVSLKAGGVGLTVTEAD